MENFKYYLTKLIIVILMIESNQAQNLTIKPTIHCIRGISFTKDNKVVTTSDDQIVRFWGNPYINFTILNSFQNANGISCCSFSYLNKNGFLSVSSIGVINVWKIMNEISFINSFNEHTSQLNALTMSNNNILATGSNDSTIKIWDLNKNDSLFTFYDGIKTFSLVFLNDSMLVSGYSDSTIKMWNILNGTCSIIYKIHTGIINSIIILSNELIASGSGDNTIRIWNITNSKCLTNLTGHSGNVRQIIKINDTIIASTSGDLSIIVWDLDQNRI